MNNNKPENIKPETEFEKRMRLRDEYWKTIHHYDINTRTIYEELSGKWKKYDSEIIDKVEEAIHHVHNLNGIMTYCYLNDGSEIAKNKINSHMESIQKRNGKPTSPHGFPMEYYYVGGYYNDFPFIVCMIEHCLVKKDDWGFDLLFAVQFSLTPILECSEFLSHHLKESFKGNIDEFAEYLDNICLEYTVFLAEKHKPFCEKFINNTRAKLIKAEQSSPEADLIETLLQNFNIPAKYTPYKTVITPELSVTERDFEIRCLDIMQVEGLIITEHVPNGIGLSIALTPKGKSVVLNGGYKKHLAIKEQNLKKENTDSTQRIKINWQGQSNSLTYLFRQLKVATNKKGEPLISNAYDEIAQFLKNNFVCFEDVKLSTIAGQLKKTDKPKKANKRIEIYL